MKSLLNIEEHPLEPFLPVNAKLLMLGSFPPQKKRWSMEFFYPNLQNDMWRIFGLQGKLQGVGVGNALASCLLKAVGTLSNAPGMWKPTAFI